MAAPASKRPIVSLAALGWLFNCSVSRKVIRPISLPFLSTIGNFSILYCSRMPSACSISVPIGAVTKRSLVITSFTFFWLFFSKRRSRFVSMPTSRWFLSTMGIPPMRLSFIIFMASPTVASGVSVIGSIMSPFSERFTLRTCSAWRSMLIFLCSIPNPPSRASPMAKGASVTVSIAADIIGILMRMSLVRLVEMFTSRGSTSE